MNELTRSEAKAYIRDNVSCKDYLQKSKSGLYCCPFCGSGNGANGTGALKVYDTNTWTCHACGKSGDVFDLYQEERGVDFKDAITELAADCGISLRSDRTATAAEAFKATPQKATESPQSDFSNGAGISKAKDENGAQGKPGQQAEGDDKCYNLSDKRRFPGAYDVAGDIYHTHLSRCRCLFRNNRTSSKSTILAYCAKGERFGRCDDSDTAKQLNGNVQILYYRRKLERLDRNLTHLREGVA